MSDNKSFVFYESWSNFIDMQDRETAKELVYQIYRAGMEKDFDTDDTNIIGIITSFILPNIQGAKRKYKTAIENGSKGGRPPKTNEETDKHIYQLHKEGWTYAQIAEEIGVSTNTVGDRVRTLRKKEEEQKTKNQNVKPNKETNIETFISKDKNNSETEIKTEIVSDSNNNLPLHYSF